MSGPPGLRVTWQLARVEAGRLLRSPYPWGAVVAILAFLTWSTWDLMPNLAAAAINAATATFLVAAVLMVVANLATLRDQRRGVPETLAALPGQADVRTRAILLASASVAGLLAALVIGTHVLLRLPQGPAAGQVDLREVLAGLVTTALLAVAGVAAGRWLPTLVAVPAILFGIGTAFFCGGAVVAPWHMPVAVPYDFEAFGRPAGPRLAFLVTLMAGLWAVTMLRHGLRRLRAGVAVAAMVALLLAGGTVAVAAPPMWSRVRPGTERTWDPELECTSQGGVTYCHYPGFGAWIPLWASAADPIVAAVPPGDRGRMPTVVQQHWHWQALPLPRPGEVIVGSRWGRGEADLADRARLAGGIAADVTGLAAATWAVADAEWPASCDGRGQARTVVALWLASRAAPVPPANVDASESVEHVFSPLANVRFGDRELDYLAALRERGDAKGLLWAHWAELLDPDTTVDDLASLLGLPVVPAMPAAEPTSEPPCQ